MKPTTDKNQEARSAIFAGYLRSSLVAAVLALVIYLAIYALTSGGLDIVTGLVIAGFTFVVTFAISVLIGAIVRQRRR